MNFEILYDYYIRTVAKISQFIEDEDRPAEGLVLIDGQTSVTASIAMKLQQVKALALEFMLVLHTKVRSSIRGS